jgi:hypothetical protein
MRGAISSSNQPKATDNLPLAIPALFSPDSAGCTQPSLSDFHPTGAHDQTTPLPTPGVARAPPPATADNSATPPSRKPCAITRSRASADNTLRAVQNVINKSQSALCRCGSRRRYRNFANGVPGISEEGIWSGGTWYVVCGTCYVGRAPSRANRQECMKGSSALSVTTEHRVLCIRHNPCSTDASSRAWAPAPHVCQSRSLPA